MKTLLFAGVAAALALDAAPAPAFAATADPRDEARVRQTVLAVPVNADLGAFDAIRPLFADRVVVDYTSLWGGEPQTLSPAELMDGWRGVLPGFDATWHEIGDLSVAVAGDRATARSTVDARHWLGEAVWRVRGRYAFALEKTQGRWRIVRLTLTLEHEEGDRALVARARDRAAALPAD